MASKVNLKNYVNDAMIEVIEDMRRDKAKYALRDPEHNTWNDLVHEAQVSETLIKEELIILSACKIVVENNKKSVFTNQYSDAEVIETESNTEVKEIGNNGNE